MPGSAFWDREGLINAFLLWTGIISEPLIMRQTEFAVYVGIVYTYLPFMILPLYSTLEKMDVSLVEAALDLGCKPWQAFAKITLPLSMPGILAGSLLVFIPAGWRIRHSGTSGRSEYVDDRSNALERILCQS